MNTATPRRDEVWCVTPEASGGWSPVTALAHLAARLLEADLRGIHPTRPYGRVRKAASLAPRRRGAGPALLLIASQPGDLLRLADARVLLGGFRRVEAWIIDSFWDDLLPRFARERRTIDRLWITDAELVGDYSRRMRVPVSWAPWGTDALARWEEAAAGAELSSVRNIDVHRLGRQPAAWNDDATNEALFARHGLTYAGRFPGHPTDGLANQRAVIAELSRSRVVLASSNLASPSEYTHPEREYLTARFTDSMACGAIVAGAIPRCRAASLLPAEGLVDIDVSSREAGVDEIVTAARSWTPEIAGRLRRAALERLDWRWRIAEIAESLELRPVTLDAEMARLRAAMEAPGAEPDETGS